jgi:hypothetical protein
MTGPKVDTFGGVGCASANGRVDNINTMIAAVNVFFSHNNHITKGLVVCLREFL